MFSKNSEFTRVTLENRLGQPVEAEILLHSDASTDLVVIRSKDSVAVRRLSKNIEYFARQLLGLCESNSERLHLVEWREFEDRECLWRWRFNWVGSCPLEAKAIAISKAGHHKYINGLLSSLTAAAA
ncbi:hypothetical protein R50072_08880 [Simiduia litorea]|uniref:hypothetical protein n=1 Tax=Simiduia litorea TaxID=1435348 RepID=UPI0036F252AB